jgi:hypothetical protein
MFEYKEVSMSNLLELIAHLNWIDRLDGVVSTFTNADWTSAYERDGVTGVIDEFLKCVSGRNSWRLYVSRDCGWTGVEIERFLFRYGVKIWGRGFTRDCLFFTVKRRQTNWAEYLLQRRGIVVSSRPFNPKNVEYGRRHAPGSEPPQRQWASKRTQGPFEEFWSWLLD